MDENMQDKIGEITHSIIESLSTLALEFPLKAVREGAITEHERRVAKEAYKSLSKTYDKLEALVGR